MNKGRTILFTSETLTFAGQFIKKKVFNRVEVDFSPCRIFICPAKSHFTGLFEEQMHLIPR